MRQHVGHAYETLTSICRSFSSAAARIVDSWRLMISRNRDPPAWIADANSGFACHSSELH